MFFVVSRTEKPKSRDMQNIKMQTNKKGTSFRASPFNLLYEQK